MSITQQASTAGYYHIAVTTDGTARLLKSNNERAFIVSQLQDILSLRSLIEDPAMHKRLAAHIDLLAYSLLSREMQFVVFAISSQSATMLSHLLVNRLMQYQSEWQPTGFPSKQRTIPRITVKKLLGPHEALHFTTTLHLGHPDWENDRYSSIGFYLHDRRGDWVRLWRLTGLYNNSPDNYYQLARAIKA